MGPEEGRRTGFGKWNAQGVSRREFLQTCAIAAAAVGLPAWTVGEIAEAAAAKGRPPVIWLHFQECTGCSETLLRASHPAVSDLILDLVSLDYHETLFAAAGKQAEEALQASVQKNAGKYVCVIEGSIPRAEVGSYCRVGGRTAVEIAKEIGGKAGAVIAIGSCASWGGIPSADPNPTGAVGVPVFSRGRRSSVSRDAPPIRTISSGRCSSTRPTGPCPPSTPSGGPPSRMRAPSTRIVRAVRTSTPAGSPNGSATRGTGTGTASTRRGARAPGPTPPAPCSISARSWGRGRSGSATPASAAPSSRWRSACRCTRPSKSTARPPPPPIPPIHADHGGVSIAAVGVAGLTVGALIGAGAMAAKKLGASKGEGEGKGENDKEAK